MLALLTSAALWWAYFDVVARAPARRLAELHGAARNTLARDAFAYLHLPLIAGIELFALGVEQVVGHTDEALKVEAADGAVRRRRAVPAGARRVQAADVRQLQTASGWSRALLCVACIPFATDWNARGGARRRHRDHDRADRLRGLSASATPAPRVRMAA